MEIKRKISVTMLHNIKASGRLREKTKNSKTFKVQRLKAEGRRKSGKYEEALNEHKTQKGGMEDGLGLKADQERMSLGSRGSMDPI